MTTLPTPTAIRSIAADLAAPRQDIEAGFVAVGDYLTQGAGLLNTLSRLFEALPEALQGEDVEQASAHLHAVATRAENLSSSFAQEKRDLTRLVDVVAAANAPISDLKRAVKMMGIVSVNARVTAAGIVGDSDDFDVFTTDIATLSNSAGQTIQDFAQVYRQLTGEVQRAADQRARFDAAHADTLSQLGTSLAATLEALDNQRASALESSAETGRVARQITGRIGSAVMALQVGDATRQRIEHVETGLAALANTVEGEAAFGETIDVEARPDAVAALSTLLQAQLNETATSFAQEVEQAERDLSALATDAQTIMAHSRDFHGGVGQGSAIAELNAQLRTAVALLGNFEAERAKLETVAMAVERTVRVLLEHVEAVQEIEANMRLVSLNAAVRCAQLGPRGASLSVIATQLRELTTETVVAAEAAMTRLDESATLAGAFGAAGKGNGQSGALETEATLALNMLAGLDERIAAALARLTSDGPKVIALLESAADQLAGQSAMAETLTDLAVLTAGLSLEPAPLELSPALSAILAGLRKHYTMDAERHVHDGLFAGDASQQSPPAAADEPEMDLAEFMF